MKVHKVILTIIDFDELGTDSIKVEIENTHYPNHCISPEVFSIETADIGEWDDDNPLNFEETAEAEWRRIFPSLMENTKL